MQEGIVIKSTGSWYEVRNENGEVVLCRLRGKIRLDGIRTTNPVAVGDKVIFEEEIYESLIDNNVWSPADYPAGWSKIEN